MKEKQQAFRLLRASVSKQCATPASKTSRKSPRSQGGTSKPPCNFPFRMTGTLTNEVLVRPGDWLFGDVDGVLVIPQEILPEAVEKVTELSRLERLSREAFRKGANFREVYEKFQRA